MNKRNKTILIGLYLSRFDKEGLSKLGFDTFTQSFKFTKRKIYLLSQLQ